VGGKKREKRKNARQREKKKGGTSHFARHNDHREGRRGERGEKKEAKNLSMSLMLFRVFPEKGKGLGTLSRSYPRGKKETRKEGEGKRRNLCFF